MTALDEAKADLQRARERVARRQADVEREEALAKHPTEGGRGQDALVEAAYQRLSDAQDQLNEAATEVGLLS